MPEAFSQSAVLGLDDAGRVVFASVAASALLGRESADLAGQPFASLFAFEIVSRDPDLLEAQWEVLQSTAASRPLQLEALRPDDGTAPVHLRLERLSAAPAWLAFLDPVSASATRAAPADTAGAHPLLDTAAQLAAESPVAFFDHDFKSGRSTYSPTWKRLLGYTDAELPDTYDSWRRLLHPDDSSAAPDRGTRRRGSGRRSFSIEVRMRHHSGHYVWVQSVGVQLFDEQGNLSRVVGAQIDIHERKETEEHSLIEEERLRLLTDAGMAAAFDLDFQHHSGWLSPAWTELFGPPAPGIAGPIETFTALLPTDAIPLGPEAWFLTAAAGRARFQTRLPARLASGDTRDIALSVQLVLSRRGELLRATGLASAGPAPHAAGHDPDIVSAMFEGLAEAVILADRRFDIQFMNAQAVRLTGISLEQARTLKLGDVFRLVHTRDGSPADDVVDLILSAEDHHLQTEQALPGRDGQPGNPIIWTARQAWDAEGRASGLAVIFRDPRQMTLTPEELIRANRFEALGQLAGGIAHDFNNLLATVLGGVSTAKDNRDFNKLDDAEQACFAAKALTRQLLAFAKGTPTAIREPLSPAELLRDAVRLAAAGSPAIVKVEPDPELPPVEVDRGQILQVFQNLIINALQAMPDQSRGRITIFITRLTLTEGQIPPLAPGGYIRVDVEDNGAGIPAENLDHIFDPFFTTKKQGTGLGLATVLSIVRKHGGQIGVSSTVGTGTTFTVFLPEADKPVAAEARQAPVLRFGTGRILFMDDDPKICELTGGMLASLDYKYDIARHGEEALQLYRRYLNVDRPYDLVIMDLTVIGGMGGEECFQQLRVLDPDVRAVVSSGYDNDEMARRYLDMGFCGYLTKPYRVTDLGRIIKTVLAD